MTSYSFYNLDPPPKEKVQPSEAPNNFKLEAFLPTKRLENPLISLQKNLLKFNIDSSPMNEPPKNEKHEFIHSKSYEILDGNNKRYTQGQNIKEKLETFMHKFKENQEKGEMPAIEVLKNCEKLKENHEIEADEELINGKENRYFNQNPQFFCYRCKKAGHFQKTCPEEDETKAKCLICLDENHHISRCDAFICYKCLKTGHMARDCKSAQGLNCYRCKKRGHKAKDCRVLIENEGEELEKGVKCLICGKKGHINCKKVEKKDEVYNKEEFSRKLKKKKKRWEDEMIKSNLEYFEEDEEKDTDEVRKRIKKKNKNKKKKKKN